MSAMERGEIFRKVQDAERVATCFLHFMFMIAVLSFPIKRCWLFHCYHSFLALQVARLHLDSLGAFRWMAGAGRERLTGLKTTDAVPQLRQLLHHFLLCV